MQAHEFINDLAPEIKVIYNNDLPKGLHGFLIGNTIELNSRLFNYYHTTPILAEEMAHYLISNGDISSYHNNINHMKEEVKARRLAHRLLVPLHKLIECYKNGLWGDIYEMCLYLEIDRSYFETVINDYKSQFGSYVKYDGYLINFEPLTIKEIKK